MSFTEKGKTERIWQRVGLRQGRKTKNSGHIKFEMPFAYLSFKRGLLTQTSPYFMGCQKVWQCEGIW